MGHGTPVEKEERHARCLEHQVAVAKRRQREVMNPEAGPGHRHLAVRDVARGEREEPARPALASEQAE